MCSELIGVSEGYWCDGSNGHDKIRVDVDTSDKHAAGDTRRVKDQEGEKKEEEERYVSTRPLSKEKLRRAEQVS